MARRKQQPNPDAAAEARDQARYFARIVLSQPDVAPQELTRRLDSMSDDELREAVRPRQGVSGYEIGARWVLQLLDVAEREGRA